MKTEVCSEFLLEICFDFEKQLLVMDMIFKIECVRRFFAFKQILHIFKRRYNVKKSEHRIFFMTDFL